LLKILIVDDEKGTRDVITRLVNWDELGIVWVGEAEDGAEAFKIAKDVKPDILLTDIKMPKMNGIQLVENLRETLPNCKIIFLTGYSDKEYLKAAIRYKAVSYVEKPVDLNELNAVLRTAVTEALSQKEQWQRKITDEMSSLCLDLINTRTDFTNLKEKINLLELQFEESYFYMTAILHFNMSSDETRENHDDIRKECLDRLVGELNTFEKKYVLGFKGNDHIILHFADPKPCFDEVKGALQNYIDIIGAMDSYPLVTAAAGSIENGIGGIPNSYGFAVIALQQRFFKGTKRVITPQEAPCDPFVFDDSCLAQIKDALNKGSQSETIVMIKRLANKIRKYPNTQPDYVRSIFFRIVMLLTIHARERNIQLLNDECAFIPDFIANSITLDEIENEIVSLINSIFSYIEINNTTGDLLAKVMNIIHNNYSDPELSVNSIAKQIYLTSSYLCVFFKKGTGKTINQYITEYRMERARELLKRPGVKIHEVASEIGYTDAKYFSRVFYRLSLSGGKEIITIGEELEHIRIYIKIQNMRFQNRINYNIEAPDEVLNYKTLKIILQPIVENSILHGIFEKDSKSGTINVSVNKKNNSIFIIIEDDGVGIPENEVESLLDYSIPEESTGYGIKNIDQRIRLYYGRNYGLSFWSKPGVGTKVTVHIPVIY